MNFKNEMLNFPVLDIPETPIPRMTLEEYAEFMDFLLAFAHPDAIRRQRELEDRHKNNPPFRIVGEDGHGKTGTHGSSASRIKP